MGSILSSNVRPSISLAISPESDSGGIYGELVRVGSQSFLRPRNPGVCTEYGILRWLLIDLLADME